MADVVVAQVSQGERELLQKSAANFLGQLVPPLYEAR